MGYYTYNFLLRKLIPSQQSSVCGAAANGYCGIIYCGWRAGVLLANQGTGPRTEEAEE
jgi:hypothetical protein